MDEGKETDIKPHRKRAHGDIDRRVMLCTKRAFLFFLTHPEGHHAVTCLEARKNTSFIDSRFHRKWEKTTILCIMPLSNLQRLVCNIPTTSSQTQLFLKCVARRTRVQLLVSVLNQKQTTNLEACLSLKRAVYLIICTI